MSTSEVFKQFFAKLVKSLPMDDPIFVAELFSHDLLPGNHYDQVESQSARAEKAVYFLKHVIKPSILTEVHSFNELLNVMENSEHCNITELAQQIRSKLKERPWPVTTADEHPTKEPTALDVAADGLRTRYLEQLPTAKADWPKHFVTSYVRLALVEKEDITDSSDQLNYITTLALRGGVDRILKKKQPIYDLREIFHYNNQPIPRLILIMGGPGIGKTTLAHEICVKWARDGYLSEDFNIVILVTLRTIQQRSLEDVIKKLIGENVYQVLKKSLGVKCLIILEGLDEMTNEQRQSDVLLMELVKDVPMEFVKARIIVTSRPNACQELNANRTIEIIGLGDKEIMEFVQNSFPGDPKSVELFSKQLDEYPQLCSLCYVPMSLVMIVRIFKYKQKSLPSTLTELYHLFVVMTLIREEKKKVITKHSVSKTVVGASEEIVCEVFADIPSEEIKLLLTLCKLAYCGFFEWQTEGKFEVMIAMKAVQRREPRVIFTKNDLIHSGIKVTDEFDGHGLLQVETLYQLTGDCVTYNFIHLTVQEFLCAVYMLTLSPAEQYYLLKEYFDFYPNIMLFYCGLTKLDFHQVVYSKLTSSVTSLKCLYEGKRNTAPHESSSPFVLNMSYTTLMPYDYVCLSYVCCHYPVTHLNLFLHQMGDSNAGILAKWCLNKTTKLQELYLRENNLTSEGMKHVMKIVTSSLSLRVLDVSENKIGDDGISLLCLQHINTLTELSVDYCGLSVKGASYIKTLLMENKLQYLNIGGNAIGDDGVRLITEGLLCNSTLTKLVAWECGISVKGAISISEWIKNNHTLQLLDISVNAIGDEGIIAIGRSLDDASISELYAWDCKITFTGAKLLTKTLINNHIIKSLHVQYNDITVDGAIAILEAAVANGVCQEMIVDEEYEKDNKVKKMMSILEERKRQEESDTESEDDYITTETQHKITMETLQLRMINQRKVHQ